MGRNGGILKILSRHLPRKTEENNEAPQLGKWNIASIGCDYFLNASHMH
jgi:hypothetical protein